jgi:dimethylhistidine N-methyltransferase
MAAYVPVDVSGDFLKAEAARLQADFAGLRVRPVVADFTGDFSLPPDVRGVAKAGFFPGSTIGNFEPPAAEDLLRHFGRVLGDGAPLIIGVDLVKDEAVLHAAYNDAAGVTAAFNLNILARAKRELGAAFDLAAFEHRAFFNAALGRIEMHLVSRKRQTVLVSGVPIRFEAGETIHTENSYKYTIKGFSDLARRAGWATEAVWTDVRGYFAVLGLRRGPD